MLQLNTNIKLIRELSGEKQLDFAKLIKTNISNLKTYENTDVRPKAKVLAAIADLAGISMHDLEFKKLTHSDIDFESKKASKDESASKNKQEDSDNAVQERALKMLEDAIKGNRELIESNKILAQANEKQTNILEKSIVPANSILTELVITQKETLFYLRYLAGVEGQTLVSDDQMRERFEEMGKEIAAAARKSRENDKHALGKRRNG